jgi:hypothetical protein
MQCINCSVSLCLFVFFVPRSFLRFSFFPSAFFNFPRCLSFCLPFSFPVFVFRSFFTYFLPFVSFFLFSFLFPDFIFSFRFPFSWFPYFLSCLPFFVISSLLSFSLFPSFLPVFPFFFLPFVFLLFLSFAHFLVVFPFSYSFLNFFLFSHSLSPLLSCSFPFITSFLLPWLFWWFYVKVWLVISKDVVAVAECPAAFPPPPPPAPSSAYDMCLAAASFSEQFSSCKHTFSCKSHNTQTCL